MHIAFKIATFCFPHTPLMHPSDVGDGMYQIKPIWVAPLHQTVGKPSSFSTPPEPALVYRNGSILTPILTTPFLFSISAQSQLASLHCSRQHLTNLSPSGLIHFHTCFGHCFQQDHKDNHPVVLWAISDTLTIIQFFLA